MPKHEQDIADGDAIIPPRQPDTISELIELLQALRIVHGDIPVRVQTLSHVWKPDVTIKDRGTKFVLLNS